MIDAIYPYLNADSTPAFEVVRYRPKRFVQRRFTGTGYIYNLNGIEPVIFRLPAIIAAVARQDIVFIVEGEKDALNLVKCGLEATTCPWGAGKWRESYNQYFIGATVALLPDNDEAGMKHIHQVAIALQAVAASVKMIRLPDLKEKEDVSDWLEKGNTVEKLLEIVELSDPYTPPPVYELHQERKLERTHNREIRMVDLLARFTEVFEDKHLYRCTLHGKDRHPSGYIYEKTNTAYCHACKQGGDIFAVTQLFLRCDFKAAKRWLESEFNTRITTKQQNVGGYDTGYSTTKL